MKKLIFLLFFCVIITASPFIPLSDESFLQPESHHIIELDNELFMIDRISNKQGVPDYRVYNFQATIGASGLYRLAGDVSQQITINIDDVTLDLGGHTISGGTNGIVVSAGLENIAIQNGVIDSVTTDCIRVNSGCSDIRIVDVATRNATFGINFDCVTNAIIRNCEMTQNGSGMVLTDCHNVIVENSRAIKNGTEGYSLLSSTTCYFNNCQAQSTGDGNLGTSDLLVAGFDSKDGYGNIFMNCVSNSTQALEATDSDSIVAGFLLRGTEQGSRIENSTSSNTQTNEFGVTVAHGMLLESTISSNLVAAQALTVGTTVLDNAWSPDMKYLAIGGMNGTLYVYSFDVHTNSFTFINSISNTTNQLRSVEFDSSGQYIATGDVSSANSRVRIYNFDRINNSLTLLDTSEANGQINGTLAWDPTGQYIAIGEQTSPLSLKVFYFDRIKNTISLAASASIAAQILAIKWSPDGRFIAFGQNTVSLSGRIYSFENNALTSVDSVALVGSPRALSWSTDGKYVAISQTLGRITVITLNSDGTIASSFVHSIGSGNSQYLAWSPDTRYLMHASNGSGVVRVFKFDSGAHTLTQIAASNTITLADTLNAGEWSPDGQFITVGFYIIGAFNFPSKNIIKNNTCYCNSGASIPSGVGIAGSSIANLIIGNTNYNNSINPFMVYTNYTFVTNVFNQLFGLGPSPLQNISIETPIITVPDIELLTRQIEDKLCDAQTKVQFLVDTYL